MLNAYYNEYDHVKAEHIRKLIREGKIPDGVVDERNLKDVPPEELQGFTQCHFFADAGQWAQGLRRAGWPDGLAVWTGFPFATLERHYALRGRRFLFHHAPPVIFTSYNSPGGHRLAAHILFDGHYLTNSEEVNNARGYEKAIMPAQVVPLIKVVLDA